jgi:hypothetical protein
LRTGFRCCLRCVPIGSFLKRRFSLNPSVPNPSRQFPVEEMQAHGQVPLLFGTAAYICGPSFWLSSFHPLPVVQIHFG